MYLWIIVYFGCPDTGPSTSALPSTQKHSFNYIPAEAIVPAYQNNPSATVKYLICVLMSDEIQSIYSNDCSWDSAELRSLFLLWLLKSKRQQDSPAQELRSLVKELKAVISENRRPHTDNNGSAASGFHRRRSAPERVNRTTLYVVSVFPHTISISTTPQPAKITSKIHVILLSEQEIFRVKEWALVSGFIDWI